MVHPKRPRLSSSILASYGAFGVGDAARIESSRFSGFFNGLIAYGVSFVHSHLESWRILFLIEGLLTVTIAVVAFIVLPENIETARWFTDEERAARRSPRSDQR